MLITKYIALGLWGWIGLYALTNEFSLTLEITGFAPFEGLLAWTGGLLFLLVNLGLHGKIPRWINWAISAGGLGAVGLFLLSLTSAVVPRRDTLWVRPWSSIKVTWTERIHYDEWCSCFQNYIRSHPPVNPDRRPPPTNIGKTLEETRQIALEAAREWAAPVPVEIVNPWVEVAAWGLVLGVGVALGLLVKWAVSRSSRDDLDKSRDDLDDLKKQVVQKDFDFKAWSTSLQKKFTKDLSDVDEKTTLLRREYEESTPATETSIAQVKQDNLKKIEKLAQNFEDKYKILEENNLKRIEELTKNFKTGQVPEENNLKRIEELVKNLETAHNDLNEEFIRFRELMAVIDDENAKLFETCATQANYQNLMNTFDATIKHSVEVALNQRDLARGEDVRSLLVQTAGIAESTKEGFRRIRTFVDEGREIAQRAYLRFDSYTNTTLIKSANAKQDAAIATLNRKVNELPTTHEVSALTRNEVRTNIRELIARIKTLEDKMP